MFIKPTKVAEGNIFDIHEDAMELQIYPANENVPCPWDADIDVSNGKVKIVGGLGPNGPRGAICSCQCLIDDFSKFYKLEAPNDNKELIAALAAAGWVEA